MPRLLTGLLGLLILAGTAMTLPYLRLTASSWRAAVTGQGWDPYLHRADYRAMQESLPEGVPVLAFVPMAHLLDFARNPFRLMDSNIGPGLPPGVPLSQDAERMADYLRGCGVSRIAAYETRDAEGLVRYASEMKENNNWAESVLRNHYLMLKRVAELANRYPSRRFGDHLLTIDLGEDRRPRLRGVAR